jgi:hypothetical protein
MAINYTTLLGLAQPVTGTEANTWGTVVNDEITALLDSAIAGAATLDVTAGNVTLTATAGVGNQARMAILLVTGTPGTTRNIVAPSQSKTYIVVNQSNASVVLKGSATTGVTIRAGQAATCVWNGADFESVASGDVDGPASATDNAIVRYDGTTGKLIQNSGVTIDDSNNVSGVVQLNATTLDATNLEVTNLKAKDGTAAGSIADSTGVVTLASSVLTTTDINGGTVDNTAIGATTASTVRATQVDIIAQGDLRLQDTTGGEFVALQAPGTLATSYTLTLPVDDGTSGQALITDGSGVLSWSTAASGDVYGPASATDNAVARYDGTTGKIIQNSAVTIADDGATVIAANSTSDGLRITQIGSGNALMVEDSANPDATPFVINADGVAVSGHTTAVTAAGLVNRFQSHANSVSAPTTGFGAYNWVDGDAAPAYNFFKARGGVIGTPSAVTSTSQLGRLIYYAYDGSNWLQAVNIAAEVDGTPGTNDMPGRLVFSTTADGASSPTERMRIDSAGQVTIGATATAGRSLLVGKNITGSTVSVGVQSNGTIQSDVTVAARNFRSLANTQAASFTLTSLDHYYAESNAFGAGSTVTSQFGFRAESSLTGATNNYGFYGNIASGTGRWNFYAAGSAANYFAGSVGIGITTPATNLDVAGSSSTSFPIIRITDTNTASANQVQSALQFYSADLSSPAAASIRAQIDIFANPNGGASELRFLTNDGTLTERVRIDNAGRVGIGAAPETQTKLDVRGVFPTSSSVTEAIRANGTIPSGTTSNASAFVSFISTEAAAFTLTDLYHFRALRNSFGAGSTVTNQHGFHAASSITGATNNYGFYSNIASGVGRWNFYAAGSAANYFAGDMQLDKTVTAGGTTGAQTINKNAGTVNFAAAATSLVVTDSRVTTSSIIICTVGTNDTTLKSVAAVAGAGSFTLHASAAATAETRVNFLIIN